MNRGGHRSRLSFLHRLGVDGSRRGIFVLLFDPRDLVVLACLSRHRGRYLSHLYLRVKKSLMARITAAFRYIPSRHNRDRTSLNSLRDLQSESFPSSDRGFYDRGCPFAPAARCAERFIGAAKSTRAFKCNVMTRTRQVANT